MRSWDPILYPYLCQKHLCACWRESLGMFDILIKNRQSSYRHHPATKEFIDCPDILWERLSLLRTEMLKRGYHPKELPLKPPVSSKGLHEWQSLHTQIERLVEKRNSMTSCKCNII